MATTTGKKRKVINDPPTDDHTFGIGLPKGVDPEIDKWDIRKMAEFVEKTGKTIDQLPKEEQDKFRK